MIYKSERYFGEYHKAMADYCMAASRSTKPSMGQPFVKQVLDLINAGATPEHVTADAILKMAELIDYLGGRLLNVEISRPNPMIIVTSEEEKKRVEGMLNAPV